MTVKSYMNILALISFFIHISLVRASVEAGAEFSLSNDRYETNYPFAENPTPRQLAQNNSSKAGRERSDISYNLKGLSESRFKSGKMLTDNPSAQQYIAYYRKLKEDKMEKTSDKNTSRKLGFLERFAENQLNKYISNPTTLQPYLNSFFGSITDTLGDIAKEHKRKKANAELQKAKKLKTVELSKADKTKKAETNSKDDKSKTTKQMKERVATKDTKNKDAISQKLPLELQNETAVNAQQLKPVQQVDPLIALDNIFNNKEALRNLSMQPNIPQIQTANMADTALNSRGLNTDLLGMGVMGLTTGMLAQKNKNKHSRLVFKKLRTKLNIEELRQAAIEHMKQQLDSCEMAIERSLQNLRLRNKDMNRKVESLTNEIQSLDTGSRPGERVIDVSDPDELEEDDQEGEEDQQKEKDTPVEKEEKGKEEPKGEASEKKKDKDDARRNIIIIKNRHLAEQTKEQQPIHDKETKKMLIHENQGITQHREDHKNS